MKKKFNNEHTPKSSDVCNKYSKSVSYETLVGGTTTTGREYKQTRRLFLSSAHKPLSAVGTLTSLLCNSAKVVEKLFYCHSEPKAKNPKKTGTVMPDLIGHLSRIKKEAAEFLGSRLLSCPRMTGKALSFLRLRGASGAQGISAPASCRKAHKRRFLFNSWILRFANAPLRMTIPTLAFLLSLNLSTAFAACDCLWGGADDKTLTITGCSVISSSSCADQKTANNVIIGTGVTSIGFYAFSGATSLTSITIPDSVKSIGYGTFQGAYRLESITIPKGVTSIGAYAFNGASKLTSITIPEGVSSIGEYAFSGASSLESITIPEGVKSIGAAVFNGAYSLTSITIPDNINTENWVANVFQYLPGGTNIVCQGDLNTCYEKLAKYIPTDKGGNCTSNCIKKDIQPALFDSCKSTNYFWDGSTCIREPDVTKRKCCTSCKDMGGWCNRIRYTPAEAAKVLTDDNNNSVTITFKK